MKLIEYKRKDSGVLEFVGEINMEHVRINHTYHGVVRNIDKLSASSHILILKKKEIQDFLNGKNDIIVYSIPMKECYSKFYSMAHVIHSHANGLVVDEINEIFKTYTNDEYVVMTAPNYGQFLEYTDFTHGKDYLLNRVEENGITGTKLTFLHPDMKEEFTWELHEEELLSISDILNEINALTRSEDVLFVHHEKGVGYATRNLGELAKLSGFIYENYLIED